MTSLRRAALLAVSLWVLLHVGIALSTTGQSARALLHLAGVAVLVVAVGTAVRPLGRSVSGPPGRLTTAALVASVPVVGLLVSLQLEGEALRGYANWWTGAVTPVIAALVVRGRAAAGVVAAAAEVVVIVVTVVADTWPHPDWLSVALLVVNPVVWLVAALVVTHVWVRTSRTVALWGTAADEAHRQALEAQARDRLAARRREEVQALVGPTLRRLASGSAPDQLDRTGTGLLEAHLRDLLGGRALVDPSVRAAASRARSRGARVSLVDDSRSDPDDVLPVRVRPLVVAVLTAVEGGTVTVRLPPDGDVATVTVSGSDVGAAALADLGTRLPSAAPGLSVEADVDDDVLFAVARVAPDEPATGPTGEGAASSLPLARARATLPGTDPTTEGRR